MAVIRDFTFTAFLENMGIFVPNMLSFAIKLWGVSAIFYNYETSKVHNRQQYTDIKKKNWTKEISSYLNLPGLFYYRLLWFVSRFSCEIKILRVSVAFNIDRSLDLLTVSCLLWLESSYLLFQLTGSSSWPIPQVFLFAWPDLLGQLITSGSTLWSRAPIITTSGLLLILSIDENLNRSPPNFLFPLLHVCLLLPSVVY